MWGYFYKHSGLLLAEFCQKLPENAFENAPENPIE